MRRFQFVFALVTALLALAIVLDAQQWVSSGSGISTSGTMHVGGVMTAGSGPTTITNSTGQVLEAAIADGTVFPRLASSETISGTWTFTNPLNIVSENSFAVAGVIRGRASDDQSLLFFQNNASGTTYGQVGATSTSGGTLRLTGTGAVAFTANVPVTNAGRYNSASAQPGFLAYNSSTDAIVASGSTVDFDAEVYDNAGNFSADTFTAPVTGQYHLCSSTAFAVQSLQVRFGIRLVVAGTSAASYMIGQVIKTDNSSDNASASGCVYVPMTASDTALIQTDSSASVSVTGGASPRVTFFSGRLVP